MSTGALLRITSLERMGGKAPREIAAICALTSEAPRGYHFAQVIEDEMIGPRRAHLKSLLDRGIRCGDVSSSAPIDMVAEVIPALLLHRVLFQHQVPDLAMVDELIEGLVMPLLVGSRDEP